MNGWETGRGRGVEDSKGKGKKGRGLKGVQERCREDEDWERDAVGGMRWMLVGGWVRTSVWGEPGPNCP